MRVLINLMHKSIFFNLQIIQSKSGPLKEQYNENNGINRVDDLHDVMNQLVDRIMDETPTIEHL